VAERKADEMRKPKATTRYEVRLIDAASDWRTVWRFKNRDVAEIATKSRRAPSPDAEVRLFEVVETVTELEVE
jgi:hypothetical protein